MCPALYDRLVQLVDRFVRDNLFLIVYEMLHLLCV